MMSIEVLKAVHHSTRRRMVDLLYLRGPSQVGAIAQELGEQVGSISHHLRMLERAGVVVRVPELAEDGRTSWWRLELGVLSWSVGDFAENAADQAQAKAAEGLNLDHQLRKLAAWKREGERADPAWRGAAFSADFIASATPEELGALRDELVRVVREWREHLPAEAPGRRAPVFVFAHGFPSRP